MQKLLIPLILLSGLSFASDLDMNSLACGSLKLNSATTLKEVQDTCQIKTQGMKTTGNKLGLYEVEFVNTSSNKSVTCDFARNESASKLNGCR